MITAAEILAAWRPFRYSVEACKPRLQCGADGCIADRHVRRDGKRTAYCYEHECDRQRVRNARMRKK